MSFGSFLHKQLIDVIDWVDEPGVLAIRYPMQDREIQNGAQLTVREGQVAMFHNEGQLADAFGPGLYTLDTQTLPVLTALMNWDKGFKSPFKSDVYFFTKREQTGLKWGTPQPITVRDKDFGPLRIRAFGSYSFRVEDIATFSVKMMGSLDHLTLPDLESQLRGVINSAIASALGTGEIAFVDMAGNQQALSAKLIESVQPAFAAWGLNCCSFFVESVSLPENVQEYLDKSSQMRVLGNLDQYTRFQAAEAIPGAAANGDGLAGIGASAAVGLSLGQAMASSLGHATAPAAPAEGPYEQIEKLHKLMVAGALTQQEFDAKKTALLAKIV